MEGMLDWEISIVGLIFGVIDCVWLRVHLA